MAMYKRSQCPMGRAGDCEQYNKAWPRMPLITLHRRKKETEPVAAPIDGSSRHRNRRSPKTRSDSSGEIGYYLPMENGRDPRRPPALMVACLLPWTADWRLDEQRFVQHVDEAMESGFRSLYILGTAGEGYALSDDDYREVVTLFADRTLGHDCRPQVGVIGLSMRHMIQRIQTAHDLGFRDFQISLPSWGALSEDETLLFFETVCSEFPDSDFLHYNLPRAKRLISGSEYRRIADRVPNLTATKNNCSREKTQDLLTAAPELQHFLLETNFVHGYAIGSCSLLCSVGLLFPKLTHELFAAGVANDHPIVVRISEFFQAFVRDVFTGCRTGLMDGAYDKIYLWLRDPDFSPLLLPPYQGLTRIEQARCREVYEARYQGIDQAGIDGIPTTLQSSGTLKNPD